MSARRKFTPEYRSEAARLVIDSDRPIAHVARELGLGEQLLGRWVHAERARPQVDQEPEDEGPLGVNKRANEILLAASSFFVWELE